VPDHAVLVVRGDELDPAVIRVDASNFHYRFSDWNRYGVSAYLATDDSEVDALCAARLIQFSTVVTFRVADLVAVGVEIVPTFRTPHVTLCHVELDALIDGLQSCEHKTWPNPYHEG
jgi:hypothetical protein